MHACVCVYLPLGGGLMSVSPCWLELSDCPESAEKEKKSAAMGLIIRIKTEIVEKKKKSLSVLFCITSVLAKVEWRDLYGMEYIL